MLVALHMVLALGVMSRDNQNDTDVYTLVALGWLGLACLSVIPTGGWLPAIITVIAMVFAWYQDRAQYLPPLLGVLFVCMAIGFYVSTDSEGIGVWSISAFLTGLIGSLLLGLNNQGLLFRGDVVGEGDLRRRKDVTELLLQISSIAYFLGFDATYGMGPVLGAAMYAKTSMDSGNANQLILFPILSSFAAYNLLAQTDVGGEQMRTMTTGGLLIAQGVFMSFITNREDSIYDSERFDWPDDDEFFGFMDRLGLTGTLYTLIGAVMAMNKYDTSYSYLIATLYLIVIGVQGFSEQTQSKWRRAVGGYGSILTAMLFASTLEQAIYQGIAIIFVGMIALGFTFLYTQRTGVGSAQVVGDGAQPTSSRQEVADSKAVIEEGEIPEPVKATGVRAKATQLAEHESKGHDAGASSAKQSSTAASSSLPAAKPRPTPRAKPKPAPDAKKQVLMTESGLGVELPSGTLDNILRAIEATPHDGYMPVLSFASNGQIMLNFEQK